MQLSTASEIQTTLGATAQTGDAKPFIQVANLSVRFPDLSVEFSSWRDLFVGATRLRTLRKQWRPTPRFVALKDISLSVQEGERVALIGFNGSGKSTLCRCLAGYYLPSAGKIQVAGNVRLVESGQAALYPELSGRENAHILANLMLNEPDRHVRHQLVEDALAFSGLGETHLKRAVRVYSSGMRTRLGLSMASAGRTDLLILDEAFDGTDAAFRVQMRERLFHAMDRAKATVFVSHSDEQLRLVCTRGIVLKHGELRYDGPIVEAINFYRLLAKSTKPVATKTEVHT